MAYLLNPKNEKDMARLRDAVAASRERLEPFRRVRLDAVRQYVGHNYGQPGNAAADKVPVNLLALGVSVYVANLAANAPAALVTTAHSELKRRASLLELALNHLHEEIDLERTLQSIVTEAMFGMGIAKIGLGRHPVEVDGVLHDFGQPFVDPVSLDDWVHDVRALTFEKARFAGNRYTLPYDYVMQNRRLFPGADDSLKPSSADGMADRSDRDRAEHIGSGRPKDSSELCKEIVLWDLWLPEEQMIVTLPAENGMKPLNVVEWEGPEVGPFRLLRLRDVPGNVMPLAPAAAWLPLHDLINRLFRKLGRQAERQKTIAGVRAGADQDGKRVLDANDGEMIRLDDPNATREYRFGGIDNANFAFLLQSKDLFMQSAGNLDVLAGTGPMSETLGQDEMLFQNASRLLADMQQRVVRFAGDVERDLAYYLWTDPLIELPLVKRVGSVDLPVSYTPEDREGDFLQYNVSIDPYSLRPRTPAARWGAIERLFAQLVAPFMPLMEAQGVTLDFQNLLRLAGKYNGIDEMEDILAFTERSGSERPGVVGTPRQSPVTTRTNVRVNRPGATQRGKDAALVQTLMGAAPQAAEVAAIGRSTG